MRNDLGDHTQFNARGFSAVAAGLSVTLASAMTDCIVRAADRAQQPPKIISAKEIREDNEGVLQAKNALLSLLVAYSQDETRKAKKETAEAKAALIFERLSARV